MDSGKILMLLRHGKSDWSTSAATDFDRPLAKRGREDVPNIARWASANGVLPDCIISSPAARAISTAQLFVSHMGNNDLAPVIETDLYPGGAGVLINTARQADNKYDALMLVGHNPGMDGALLSLCGTNLPFTDSGKLMTTAALAVIRLPAADWRDLAPPGQLLHLIRPKAL